MVGHSGDSVPGPLGFIAFVSERQQKSDTVCRLSEPKAVLGSLPSVALSPAVGKYPDYSIVPENAKALCIELKKE